MAGRLSLLGAGRQIPPSAPASGWWLSGSISAANCIIAYQPKGAASLAASYSNLANPETYDATAGTAPDWDSTNGWKFVYASGHYLKTGFQHTSGNKYSAICRFSNYDATNLAVAGNLQFLMGGRDVNTASRFYLGPGYIASGEKHAYGWSGTTAPFANYITSGVMCIAAGKSYLDGSEEGSGTESTLTATGRTVYIGAQNQGTGTDGDTPLGRIAAYIQAIAIYDIALSPAQVSALTTAMNAL